MRKGLLAILALALPVAAGAQPAHPDRARPGAAARRGVSAVRAEAEAFMAGYARDLRAGDRAAIAARYDRRGSWRVGGGTKRFEPWALTRDHYAGPWTPPASFAWSDLSYEVLGPDAVLVTGLFRWGLAGRDPLIFSYTGLLVRQGRELRIRLEDESGPAPGTGG